MPVPIWRYAPLATVKSIVFANVPPDVKVCIEPAPLKTTEPLPDDEVSVMIPPVKEKLPPTFKESMELLAAPLLDRMYLQSENSYPIQLRESGYCCQ